MRLALACPRGRVDSIEIGQQIVKLWVMAAERVWASEEAFSGHGKELGPVGGAVFVQHGRASPPHGIFQALELLPDHLVPSPSCPATPQRRRAVSMNKNLEKERNQLKQWAPLAAQAGVRWLAWSPGSPIEKFMEVYEWTSTALPASSES